MPLTPRDANHMVTPDRWQTQKWETEVKGETEHTFKYCFKINIKIANRWTPCYFDGEGRGELREQSNM